MTGTIDVQPRPAYQQGPKGTIFKIKIATVDSPPDGMVYDVQWEYPGQWWQDYAIGIRSKNGKYDSSQGPTGKILFRSRLRRLSDGVTSDWSKPVDVFVEP